MQSCTCSVCRFTQTWDSQIHEKAAMHQTYGIQTSTASPVFESEILFAISTNCCSHSANVRFLLYSLVATPCCFASLETKALNFISAGFFCFFSFLSFFPSLVFLPPTVPCGGFGPSWQSRVSLKQRSEETSPEERNMS